MNSVTIQCGTSKHSDAKALAWAAILIYPVGLLVLNGALLFAARHAIATGKHTLLSRSIAFLYREYEVHLFWWELVEMTRRFVLVGLMVLAQDSMMQLVVGTILSALFLLFQVQAATDPNPDPNREPHNPTATNANPLLLLQVQAAPYTTVSDDFLASVASFLLTVIFICSYAFKNHTFVGLPDIEVKMSREQRALYIIDQAALSAVVAASVVGGLIFSSVLFLVQLTIERRLQLSRLRASKARRLRYKATGGEVIVPVMDDDAFHLFLSHVWGTGQDQMRIVKQRLLEARTLRSEPRAQRCLFLRDSPLSHCGTFCSFPNLGRCSPT